MTSINNTSSVSLPNATAATVKDTYLDQNSLNSVKAMGRHNDPQALKEISKKFEAMFVQQMLKSMRDANEVFAEGDMFSSDEVKFHQDMLDQQMVLNLTSGEGIGLAKSMYQQMQRNYGKHANSVDELVPVNKILSTDTKNTTTETKESVDKKSSVNVAPAKKTEQSLGNRIPSPEPPALISRAGIKTAIAQTPEEFIAKLKPYAEKAAAELNVNVDVILAQAALETGWGKSLIHDDQGKNSFNMFNIKAGTNWQGKSVSINSVEYHQGIPQIDNSRFKKYESYVDSFADYVKMIKNNPRYQKVLAAGNDSVHYANALQQSGYATDPQYAEKIKRLLDNTNIRSAVDAMNSTYVDAFNATTQG